MNDDKIEEVPALHCAKEIAEPSQHGVQVLRDIVECLAIARYWRERAEDAERRLASIDRADFDAAQRAVEI